MLTTVWQSALIRCKLLWHRPWEVLLLLLIVPVSIALLTYLLPGNLATEGIPLAIVDQDESQYSRLVIERLSQEPLVQAQLVDEETATRMLLHQEIEGAFIIKEGFMERMLQGERREVIQLLQSPASLAVGLLRELVVSEVLRLGSNVQAANFVQEQYLRRELISTDAAAALWQEAWQHSDSYWEPEPLMTIRYLELPPLPSQKETVREEPQGESGSQTVGDQLTYLLGWLAALLLLLIIFLQQWLVEEKENGLLQRVKGSSNKLFCYVLGHSLPIFLLVLFAIGLTFVPLSWKFNINLLLSWPLVSLILVYLGVCFTLAFCLATWVSTTAQLQGTGLTIVLLTSIFGGVFVPLTEWTSILQYLTQLTPQGWFLKGVRATLAYSATTTVWWLSLAVLLTFSIIFCCAGIWRWRKA